MPRRPIAHWLLPAILALSLYAVTIPGTYTYDDMYTVKDDERLHDFHRWGEYLHEGYFPGAADNLWRPLVSLSYAVEWQLHGSRPWIFHLINVLLHATATAMVAALAYRVSNASRKIALLAGLLFAVHPVHVEAVAGIVGRAEEMALIGILIALLLFVGRTMTPKRAWAIVGCFLLAAFCKEQGLLIPFMMLIWSLLHRRWPTAEAPPAAGAIADRPIELNYASPRERTPPQTPEQAANRLLAAVLTITLAAYVSYRNHILPWYWERGFLDPTFNPLVKTFGIDRWLIPVAVLGRYATLLIAPLRLSIDYGMGVFTTKLDWHDPYFYLGIVATIFAAGTFCFLWRRRNAAALFIFLCFAMAYFMVSNFIMIGTIMGERLMYVPSAFFCILIAMAIARIPSRALIPITALVLVLGCIRTVSYACQWNTRPRLYRYAIEAQPRAAMPYLLLAGETDAPTSDALMATARQVAPDSPQVWGKSAWAKIRVGQLDDAYQFALQSQRLRGGNADAMGAMTVISQMRQAATQPTSRPTR